MNNTHTHTHIMNSELKQLVWFSERDTSVSVVVTDEWV